MDRSVVHDVHMMINVVHRLVYFVPEAVEEYAAVGVNGAGGYFGSRAAPLGAVPDEVIIATFYNFSPLAVTSAMQGVWEAAPPDSLQAARFRVVNRAMERVGIKFSTEQIAEARALIVRSSPISTSPANRSPPATWRLPSLTIRWWRCGNR